LLDQSFISITTTRYLPAFLAVARHGSFTKAATALHVSQPAVTMAVHQLEELVGVRLFERNTRRVTLTAEGLRFAPTAERLLADLEDGIRGISSPLADEKCIRIAAVPSVATKVLPHAVAQFAVAHPDVRIELQDANSITVSRRIRWQEADLGFASLRDHAEDTHYLPLFRDRIGVLARAGHNLFRRDGDIEWHALNRCEFVSLAGDVASGVLARTPGLPPNVLKPHYEASYNTVLWAMLQSSDRVNAIPALFAPDRIASGLAFRPLRNPDVWRTVYAVLPAQKPPTPMVAQLLSLVRDVVSSLGENSSAVQSL
jgi:LysR family transcriptional regulator, carnitine catabolism transcriptional activator